MDAQTHHRCAHVPEWLVAPRVPVAIRVGSAVPVSAPASIQVSVPRVGSAARVWVRVSALASAPLSVPVSIVVSPALALVRDAAQIAVLASAHPSVPGVTLDAVRAVAPACFPVEAQV